MSFYVTTAELTKLTGRSRQDLQGLKTSGRIDAEKTEANRIIYDLDDPRIQRMVKTINPDWKASRIREIRKYQAEFNKARATQKKSCAKTKMVDYMAELEPETVNEILSDCDESKLDRHKKEAEIEYKRKQIEKMDVALNALTGDLIDRVFVETYIRRYLGALHQQILNLASTGIMDDLYNLFKREEDGRKAIKEGERLLEKRSSDLLKDATSAMKTDSL